LHHELKDTDVKLFRAGLKARTRPWNLKALALYGFKRLQKVKAEQN